MFCAVMEDQFHHNSNTMMMDEEDYILQGLDRLLDYFGFNKLNSQFPGASTTRTEMRTSSKSFVRKCGWSEEKKSEFTKTVFEPERKSLKRKQCSDICSNVGEEKSEERSCAVSKLMKKDLCSSNNDLQVRTIPVKVEKTNEQISTPKPKANNIVEVKLAIDPKYRPGEVQIKLQSVNRSLIIEGCHQESRNGGGGLSQTSTRMFQRFSIPEEVDLEGLQCDFSQRGTITISAPLRKNTLPVLNKSLEKSSKAIPSSLCSPASTSSGLRDKPKGGSKLRAELKKEKC